MQREAPEGLCADDWDEPIYTFKDYFADEYKWIVEQEDWRLL